MLVRFLLNRKRLASVLPAFANNFFRVPYHFQSKWIHSSIVSSAMGDDSILLKIGENQETNVKTKKVR